MTALKTDDDLETRPYRSISEVSEIVGVKAHVLRYWETQFSMLRPKKNRAGNRMYRPEEVQLLMRIKELLYARRFTIAGARRSLLDDRKEAGKEAGKDAGRRSGKGSGKEDPQVELGFESAEGKLLINEVRAELRRLADRLRTREEPVEV